jgi:hypothetical protein
MVQNIDSLSMYPYHLEKNQGKLEGFLSKLDCIRDGFTETYISQQPTKGFTLRYDTMQLRQKPDPLPNRL